MARDATRDDHLVQGGPPPHRERRAGGNGIESVPQGVERIVEVGTLDAGQIAERTEVQPQERNAGKTVDGRKHRPVASKNDNCLGPVIRNDESEVMRQRRQVASNGLNARLVVVDVKRNSLHDATQKLNMPQTKTGR